MIIALIGGLLLVLALFSVLTGGAIPFFPFTDLAGQPGPGGGPGGAATSGGPTPSPPLSPVATPRVTPIPTPSSAPPSPTPAGGGGGGQVPTISSRQITSGSAQVNVSGFFGVDAEVPINTVVSYAVETDTWLFYGTTGSQSANVGIKFDEPDTEVEITRGAYRATPTGDECTMQVDVTTSSISGHISCSGVTALNLIDGTTGIVAIEIDFTANS